MDVPGASRFMVPVQTPIYFSASTYLFNLISASAGMFVFTPAEAVGRSVRLGDEPRSLRLDGEPPQRLNCGERCGDAALREGDKRDGESSCDRFLPPKARSAPER